MAAKLAGTATALPVNALLVGLLLCCCVPISHGAPPVSWRAVADYPHRSDAFTQGLLVMDGAVIESSGHYGRSFIARWRIDSPGTAEIERQPLPRRYFAEGLAQLDGKLYLLTWRAGRGFVFDAHTLERESAFRYRGEGWGLASNGLKLIMSDGSARLRFLDPADFSVSHVLTVTDNGAPIDHLNELEWIPPDSPLTDAPQGRLLANRWLTDTILVIDPLNGNVTGELALADLYPASDRIPEADVLNGIAYDPHDATLLVTGKYWPHLYRLKLPDGLP